MHSNIAIYRPEDIPTPALSWEATFTPIMELLQSIGVTATMPQKRLHPNWREQEQEDCIQGYDVVEVAAEKFAEHRQQLASLGFLPWPDQEDPIANLYEPHNDH